MGDLDVDTQVEGSNGGYRARLSEEWEIWGPCGGYVAAIALRAAAAEATLDRPASFACQYLAPGAFDAVDLEVVRIGATKRSESIRVSMTQRGRPILESLVRFTETSNGLRHDATSPPDVPDPGTLKTWEEIGFRPPYPFWNNLEACAIDWHDDWLKRPPGDPVYRQWYRFRPTPIFDDPILDAARLLIVLDIGPWPAATAASTGRMEFIAPSLDLAVRFHRSAPDSDWLFGDAIAPIAEDGLVSGSARVWSRDGRLLASGEQHMLCRPNPAEG